jgi:hypothetical protein
VNDTARLLDHPIAIEERLRGAGFVARRDGMAMSLPELYSRAFDASGGEVLVHAQLVASAGGGLQLALRGYFDASQWAPTLSLLESLLESLHRRIGRVVPEVVCTHLRAMQEIESTDDDTAFALNFPADEPDADFSVVDLTLCRALDEGEWQAWLSLPPLADQVASEAARKDAILTLCRERLRAVEHPLADADLGVLGAIGNADGALFTVMAPAFEAVLFCDLGDNGSLSISLVDASGIQTTL